MRAKDFVLHSGLLRNWAEPLLKKTRRDQRTAGNKYTHLEKTRERSNMKVLKYKGHMDSSLQGNKSRRRRSVIGRYK